MYTLTLILFVFIVVSPCLTKIDFQIQCFSLTFHVMIFILCERSRYFYAANNIKSNINKISKTRLKSWKPKFLYCPHACSDKWTAFWFQGSLMRGVAHSHISISFVQLSLFCDCRGGARQQTTSITAGNYNFIKSWWRILWPSPYCKCFCILMRFNWSDIFIST